METERGRYEAGALVVAAGAWSGRVLGEYGFRTSRCPSGKSSAGSRRAADASRPRRSPCSSSTARRRATYYGFPERAAGEGFKVGRFHHRRETVDPDAVDRRILPEDEAVLRWIGRYLSAPMGAPVGFKTCMFVNSPDEHFIVDLLPGHGNVAVAAGFSGHGYKFCSGIGEILADLAMHGATPHDTRLFSLERDRGQTLRV